ncbi:ATP synthase subunit delta [Alphaproteobacteria bacterium]|nr:ATP synthase subunit delta [Alphaproteobacteria bacterium]
MTCGIVNFNSFKALSTSLPGRYAAALFEEGKRTDCLKDIIMNFESMDKFFAKNVAIQKLLTSASISAKSLIDCWNVVGAHLGFRAIFVNFMIIVVKNKRYDIINMIRHIFDVAFSAHMNKRWVVVTTAVALSTEQKKRLLNVLGAFFSEKVSVSYKIDQDILGGIKINSDDIIADASVVSRIRQVAEFMSSSGVKVAYHED